MRVVGIWDLRYNLNLQQWRESNQVTCWFRAGLLNLAAPEI